VARSSPEERLRVRSSFRKNNKMTPVTGVILLVAHVGARWNELVSELERWHEFGKAREMAQELA
jgi:hypothetical protein